jgi:hypothetical protein
MRIRNPEQFFLFYFMPDSENVRVYGESEIFGSSKPNFFRDRQQLLLRMGLQRDVVYLRVNSALAYEPK